MILNTSRSKFWGNSPDLLWNLLSLLETIPSSQMHPLLDDVYARNEFCPHETSTPHLSPPLTSGSHHLLSVSMGVTLLGTSSKWNPTVFVLLWPVYFTEHHAPQSSPTWKHVSERFEGPSYSFFFIFFSIVNTPFHIPTSDVEGPNSSTFLTLVFTYFIPIFLLNYSYCNECEVVMEF